MLLLLLLLQGCTGPERRLQCHAAALRLPQQEQRRAAMEAWEMTAPDKLNQLQDIAHVVICSSAAPSAHARMTVTHVRQGL